MKLVMTLLVRDEEDIVATHLEYHLSRGVDFVIATDNLSRDGTRAILADYAARGVLHLIDERSDDYSQGRWVTRMARLAHARFGADWVINSDADEFWWPEAGGLKDVLGAVPAQIGAVSAARHNFVPRPRAPRVDFIDAMTVREARSLNAQGAPLPAKACHRACGEIEVEQGNHVVRRAGKVLEAPPAALGILHFPVRSYAQFANKIAVGGAAYQRNRELPREVGSTWRMLYEKLGRGELPDYYRSMETDDAALARGLAEGRLVVDERLRNWRRGSA